MTFYTKFVTRRREEGGEGEEDIRQTQLRFLCNMKIINSGNVLIDLNDKQEVLVTYVNRYLLI